MKQRLELKNLEVELRGITQESGELKVSGYVNKTGLWSELLGSSPEFRETILPGTFDSALQKGNDVAFLAEHDSKKLLASTKNKSLTLREDKIGLYMEATISATSWGKDYHRLIADGLLTNMSFGMQVNADEWEKQDDGTYNRSISDIHLAEISVVRNPAYLQSTIASRSIESIEPQVPQIKLEEQQTMDNEKRETELINELLELRNKTKAPAENVVEVRSEKPSTLAIETRQVEEFLKGNVNAPELREISTVNNSMLVPTVLLNQVIKLVVEKAEIFKRTRQHRPVIGTLEILRETSRVGATFIGEYTNAEKSNFTMDKVVLEQKRAATALELTQQLINDSGIDVVQYAINSMSTALAEEMDKSTLIGDKNNKQFEGLLSAVLPASHVSSYVLADGIKITDLHSMVLKTKKAFLKGSTFVMNRDRFEEIANLQYADGRFVMVTDVVNDEPVYKLFGFEILIHDDMPAKLAGDVAVAFVNFEAAMASMVKKGASFKRISDDTTNALKGTQLLVLDIYADAKIINENAIRFLEYPAGV